MDTMDQIFLWKQLYWEAIERGLGPDEAARAASLALPARPQEARPREKTVSDSPGYPPVAA